MTNLSPVVDRSGCEPFHQMISEMLDDEITPADAIKVAQHLDDCFACCETVKQFKGVDLLVTELSAASSSGSHSPPKQAERLDLRPTSPARDELSTAGRRKLLWRLAPLATSAALVVGLLLSIFQTPKPVTANDFSAQEYAQPLKELHVLNMHHERDQDLMLKLLDMDLRALKLELNQLEGSKERGDLTHEIDLMLAKVKRFDSF